MRLITAASTDNITNTHITSVAAITYATIRPLRSVLRSGNPKY